MMRSKLPTTLKLGEFVVLSVGGGDAARMMRAYGNTQEATDEPRAIPGRLGELVRTLVALKKQGKKR